jgi:hypothetical protein
VRKDESKARCGNLKSPGKEQGWLIEPVEHALWAGPRSQKQEEKGTPKQELKNEVIQSYRHQHSTT